MVTFRRKPAAARVNLAAPARRSGASTALYAATALTLLLYLVAWIWPPLAWLGRPLVLLATLVHELGHALAATALGGEVDSLRVWADASGVAQHRGDYGAAARATIAAAGPLGPPLCAMLAFLAARRPERARVALGVASVVLVLVLAAWVRNVFGVLFVAFLAALAAVIAWRASPRVAQVACAFLGIELCLSTFARADALFAATARTGAGAMPSDAAQIAQALVPPYWLWGGLIALASLAILVLGLRAVLRAMR